MDNFLKKLKVNIPEPVLKEGKIAVAFSGGADSLALLEAIRRIIGHDRLIALHCNFGLRGPESDADEHYAGVVCKKLNIDLHTKRFHNLKDEARETGESIEMICRRLRYSWFENFSKKGYWIALGHHIEDNRETFFLNLFRGTGIKGLAGMRPIDADRHLLRPLLNASRKEIEEFLIENGLEWRTDSSNLVPDIKRNKLRLKLFPEITQLFSASAFKGIDKTIEYSTTDYTLLKEYLDRILACCHDARKGEIDMETLRGLTSQPSRVLFELLRDYGFNHVQCKGMTDIEKGTGYATFHAYGATVFASYHSIKIDTDTTGRNEAEPIEAGSIEELASKVPGLKVERMETDNAMNLVKSIYGTSEKGRFIVLDADSLNQSLASGSVLKWRAPEHGDRMKPFGMKSKTRLASDILSDAHASPTDKSSSRLLTIDDTVLWLAPYRASVHHPVTENTKHIYVLRLSD